MSDSEIDQQSLPYGLTQEQLDTIMVAGYVLERAAKPLHARMLRRQFPLAFEDES